MPFCWGAMWQLEGDGVGATPTGGCWAGQAWEQWHCSELLLGFFLGSSVKQRKKLGNIDLLWPNARTEAIQELLVLRRISLAHLGCILGSGFGLLVHIFEASAEKSNMCSTVLFWTCWLCCQTNEPVTGGCIPNSNNYLDEIVLEGVKKKNPNPKHILFLM